MIVTMSDINLESLIKRCEEKERQGYEYVTDIKNENSYKNNYEQGYAGQWNYQGSGYNSKYKVAMRTPNKGGALHATN